MAKFRHTILDAIFQSIFFDLAPEDRSPNLEKSLTSIGKINIFCFQAIQHDIASGCDFGVNLVPFWLPKPIKIASWRCLEASWRHLGASWGRFVFDFYSFHLGLDFLIDL